MVGLYWLHSKVEQVADTNLLAPPSTSSKSSSSFCCSSTSSATFDEHHQEIKMCSKIESQHINKCVLFVCLLLQIWIKQLPECINLKPSPFVMDTTWKATQWVYYLLCRSKLKSFLHLRCREEVQLWYRSARRELPLWEIHPSHWWHLWPSSSRTSLLEGVWKYCHPFVFIIQLNEMI